MSHYDCKECGERPQACECAKARKAERKAYWSAEALKRRQAIEKTRAAHERMKVLLGPDADNTICLGIVLDLAEPKAREAARFAQADY